MTPFRVGSVKKSDKQRTTDRRPRFSLERKFELSHVTHITLSSPQLKSSGQQSQQSNILYAQATRIQGHHGSGPANSL